MGDLIRLSDRIYNWTQVFTCTTKYSTLNVYVNEGTGELEVVQANDDGEAITTSLSTVDSAGLIEALKQAHLKIAKK